MGHFHKLALHKKYHIESPPKFQDLLDHNVTEETFSNAETGNCLV